MGNRELEIENGMEIGNGKKMEIESKNIRSITFFL